MEKNKKKALRVATLTTPDAVRALRDTWRRWHTQPNTEMDSFLAVIASRKEVIRPHVLVAYSEGKPVAMLVGRLEFAAFDLKIGYKVLLRPTARVLRVLHSGLLGKPSEEVHKAFLSELLDTLSRREVEAVVLSFLPVGFGLYRVVRGGVKPWRRDHFAMLSVHWSIELPETYDDYLRTLSKSRRKSVRRRAKVLKSEFGGSLAVKQLTCATELDKILGDIESVAARTYQRALGAGFRNDKETRRRMELALSEGRLNTLVLYRNGKPIAFDSACRSRDALFLNECGYDPEYASYGLGSFLLCRQIEHACGDPKVHRVDFGVGPSRYKESFGNKCWHEKSVCIFAPTLRGLVLSVLQSFSNGVHHLAYRSLRRIGVFEKVRKVLRTRQSMGNMKAIAFGVTYCLEYFAAVKLY